jgi:hypothetical protein
MQQITTVHHKSSPTGYCFTFFWWLDLISILSLFPEIGFIAEPLGLSGLSNSVPGQGERLATCVSLAIDSLFSAYYST